MILLWVLVPCLTISISGVIYAGVAMQVNPILLSEPETPHLRNVGGHDSSSSAEHGSDDSSASAEIRQGASD